MSASPTATLRPYMASVFACAALFSALVWWAAVSEISQSARAAGLVIASARTQIIQVAIEGVLAKVQVSEGERVSKGQVLALLDRGQAEASFLDSHAKVAALKATLARLTAEVLDPPLVFPKEVLAYPKFVANQTALFRRRQSAVHGDVAALERSQGLVDSEMALNKPLVETGDVGRAEVIRLERQSADLAGQISARRSKYLQDAQAEMTRAEEELATQEQILAERTAVLERTRIYAPADGLVKNIQITTPGAKVRAGDVILELVPTASELIVEVKLRPADVAQVRVGMPASVKLDAYDYSVFGMLKGSVRYISPDVLTERSGLNESLYYRIQIQIDPAALQAHNQNRPSRHIDISPGMTCIADIETGKRTVLSYLTKPISKTMSESMREK